MALAEFLPWPGRDLMGGRKNAGSEMRALKSPHREEHQGGMRPLQTAPFLGGEEGSRARVLFPVQAIWNLAQEQTEARAKIPLAISSCSVSRTWKLPWPR